METRNGCRGLTHNDNNYMSDVAVATPLKELTKTNTISWCEHIDTTHKIQ